MDAAKPTISADVLSPGDGAIELVGPDWGRSGWLRAGFSTREGGISSAYGGEALNLGWTVEDTPDAVAENRRRLVGAASLGLGSDRSFRLVTARQVHSADIHIVPGHGDALQLPDGRPTLTGDGLVTDVPGLLLGVGAADCVPVLVADPQRRAVGAFHAGWRGTVQRIVEKGIATMVQVYGSRAADLVAAIGPSVGPCCYAVGDEVRSRFAQEFRDAETLFETRGVVRTRGAVASEGEVFLNLWEANRRQLIVAGVAPNRITVMGECTSCAYNQHGARKYFSHRAEHGVAGRMLGVIGIVDIPPGR